MIWLIFFLATFLVIILFLNMIIAIMSDTYSRVSAAWLRSALIERTRIYADFMPMIQLSSEVRGQKYLYVVKPIESETDQDSQNVSLHMILDHQKKSF